MDDDRFRFRRRTGMRLISIKLCPQLVQFLLGYRGSVFKHDTFTSFPKFSAEEKISMQRSPPRVIQCVVPEVVVITSSIFNSALKPEPGLLIKHHGGLLLLEQDRLADERDSRIAL